MVLEVAVGEGGLGEAVAIEQTRQRQRIRKGAGRRDLVRELQLLLGGRDIKMAASRRVTCSGVGEV